MHLTGEQNLTDTVKMLKDLGGKPDMNDNDIVEFLHQYKLHYPVVSDSGAIASVRSLVQEVDPGRGFAIVEGVSEKFKPHIKHAAQELGYPTDLLEMTPSQQKDVWQMLDTEIKESDYELWRTKQVNDWLNGVWAQVYGTMYSGLINPILLIRDICRVAGPTLLLAWIGVGVLSRRRHRSVAAVPVTEPMPIEGLKAPAGE